MTLADFFDNVDQSAADGCWPWRGHIGTHGSGTLWFDGTRQLAHRVAWFLSYGTYPSAEAVRIPECVRMDCCNPNHRRDGSHGVAVQNGIARGTWAIGTAHHNGAQTVCLRGHRYTADNVYTHNGKRNCRECGNARRRKVAA